MVLMQALMNHIFGEYIGSFMDVYLDDIVMKEKLYLSEKKLQFLCDEIKILGRVITSDGIKMDREKVDRILHWKVPTNRTLWGCLLRRVPSLARSDGPTPNNAPLKQ